MIRSPACGGVVYGQTGLTSCVLASLPTATTEPTAEPECLTGWTRESSSCYRVFNISKLWQNAETSCKTEASGAHLVSISSEEENLFVRNLAQGPTSPATAVQIGLRHYSDEGVDAQGMPVFRWIDGTPFVFQKWSPDQPNVVSSENIGTNLFLSSSEWNDFGFDQFPNPYVCEYKLQ